MVISELGDESLVISDDIRGMLCLCFEAVVRERVFGQVMVVSCRFDVLICCLPVVVFQSVFIVSELAFIPLCFSVQALSLIHLFLGCRFLVATVSNPSLPFLASSHRHDHHPLPVSH